jgi:hypothetical protein
MWALQFWWQLGPLVAAGVAVWRYDASMAWLWGAVAWLVLVLVSHVADVQARSFVELGAALDELRAKLDEMEELIRDGRDKEE